MRDGGHSARVRLDRELRAQLVRLHQPVPLQPALQHPRLQNRESDGTHVAHAKRECCDHCGAPPSTKLIPRPGSTSVLVDILHKKIVTVAGPLIMINRKTDLNREIIKLRTWSVECNVL